MEDKTLLNISLIITFAGIVALLILSYYDKIPEKNFNEITSSYTGSAMKVQGTVKQVYTHNSSISLKLEQTCLMDVTIFEKDQNYTVGDNLAVTGTVQEYNGKMEILADKIVKR
jgi:hypothetical protein